MDLLPRLFILCLFVLSACAQIRNIKVTRTINLQTHIVRIKHDIHVDLDKSSQYIFVLDQDLVNNLSFISAHAEGKALAIQKDLSQNVPQYLIHLPGSGFTKFTVNTVFPGVLVPKPPYITQAEKQFVKYVGNTLYYSSYPTESQNTVVVLPRGEVISYGENNPLMTISSEKVNYGPYKSKPPFSTIPLILHYENGAPFLTITSMTRLIELSHWGNIAVEETIEIVHNGAKLRGPFSRFEYQRGIGRHASVESFKTLLPSSAKDIYYRDEIGNISTSDVRDTFDAIELELRPRFPLFGGWKTKYTIGYNVPAYEYLFNKDNKYGLKMRLIDHAYDAQNVEEFTLKVVLPETVDEISMHSPYPVDESREVLKTYLDTTGRTVIVSKASNLVEEHIQDFTVYYRFNALNMIREPIMVTTAFIIVFICAILYVRLDFSLYKDEVNEVRLKTQTVVDEVQTIQDKRSALHQAYEDAISKYKSSKDMSRFTTDRRKIEADQKLLSQRLNALQVQLTECWSEGAEKLNELQTYDQRYRDLLHESAQLAERLLVGKTSKAQYQASEGDLTLRKLDLSEKSNCIMENL